MVKPTQVFRAPDLAQLCEIGMVAMSQIPKVYFMITGG